MTEIVCDNIKHKKILDKYIHSVKAAIYYITEDETVGKFGNFNDVLDMIISYSNEFREDHKHQDSLMLESLKDGTTARWVNVIEDKDFELI